MIEMIDYDNKKWRVVGKVEGNRIDDHTTLKKSYGCDLVFNVTNKKDKIKVFTTRPDTIFGATFIALSPDHELSGSFKNEKKINNGIRSPILNSKINNVLKVDDDLIQTYFNQ